MILQSAAKAARAHAADGVTAKHSPMLHWLVSLGAMGVFGVAILDSSPIPLPLPGSTDLLLLLLTTHNGTTAMMATGLAASAVAGAMIGGYLTWETGRKGGQAMLEKRIPARLLKRVNRWMESNGFLSVAAAAFLPPPIPLTPFVLAAGALGVSRMKFLLSFATGRIARYGLLAWVGFTFGRHVVRLWQKTLSGWTAPILWSYGCLVAIGIGYGIWKYLRSRNGQSGAITAAEEVA
jgi:membrane protein DedA with SNARE-associated domain